MSQISDGLRPLSNFLKLTGRWETSGNSASYLGPVEASPGEAGHGLVAVTTDPPFREGTLRVGVTFSTVPESTGGLMLAPADQLGSAAIYVQVGAYNAAYSVFEYSARDGVNVLGAIGQVQNLEASTRYNLEVQVRDRFLRLAVNGARVLTTVLPRPLPLSQVGLSATGPHSIEFSDLRVQTDQLPPRAFVAMPFAEPFDTLYREVIKPQAENLGFEVVRIDEIARPGIIFEEIKQQISEADVVIAEISAPNQNVFYELGYAHALDKPTILLARGSDQLPFDIRSYRVIIYDDTIGGKPAVERLLKKHLTSVLRAA